MAGPREGTYLDRIIAWHRARAEADGRDLGLLADEAAKAIELHPPRPFTEALRRTPGVAVIAELKRRSPSKGELDPALQADVTAKEYEEGGAACLSVLTDSPHFGGSPEDLVTARQAVSIPVLRKDFTVAEADVYDARIMGADAILLIVAALSDDELERYLACASSLRMAGLVEVHDEAESARALAAGASLVGVNQRDLHSFETDPDRAVRLASLLPAGTAKVAESGISRSSQLEALTAAGFDAALIGESFVRAPDRAAAVRAFVTSQGAGA